MRRFGLQFLAVLSLSACAGAAAATASTGVADWLVQQRRIEQDARLPGALSLPALSERPDQDVAALAAALPAESPFVQRQIVRTLGELDEAPEVCLPVLRAAMIHEDPRVRAHAVLAMARFGRNTEPLLHAGLRERIQQPADFADLVTVLQHVAEPDVAALVELLRFTSDRSTPEPAPTVQAGRAWESAADYFARVLPGVLTVRDQSALESLARFAADPDPTVRRFALDVLIERPPGGGAPLAVALFDLWANPAAADRNSVGKALLATGKPGEQLLVHCLREHASSELRREAVELLATRGRVGVATWLDCLAGQTDSDIRELVLEAALRHWAELTDFDAVEPLLRAALADPGTRTVVLEEGPGLISELPEPARARFVALLVDEIARADADPAELLHALADAGPAAQPARKWLIQLLRSPEENPSRENLVLRALRNTSGWDAATEELVTRIAADPHRPSRDTAALALAAQRQLPPAVLSRVVREYEAPAADRQPEELEVFELVELLRAMSPSALIALAANDAANATLRAAALLTLSPAEPEARALALQLLQSKETVVAETACEWLLDSPEMDERAAAVRGLFQPRAPEIDRLDIADIGFLPKVASQAPDVLLEQTVAGMIREQNFDDDTAWTILGLAWPRADPSTRERLATQLLAQLPRVTGFHRRELIQTLQSLPAIGSAEATAVLARILAEYAIQPEDEPDPEETAELLELLAKHGKPDVRVLPRIRAWCRSDHPRIRVAALAALAAMCQGHTMDEAVWHALRDPDPDVVRAAVRALEPDYENLGAGSQSWIECQITLQLTDQVQDELRANARSSWPVRTPASTSPVRDPSGVELAALENTILERRAAERAAAERAAAAVAAVRNVASELSDAERAAAAGAAAAEATRRGASARAQQLPSRTRSKLEREARLQESATLERNAAVLRTARVDLQKRQAIEQAKRNQAEAERMAAVTALTEAEDRRAAFIARQLSMTAALPAAGTAGGEAGEIIALSPFTLSAANVSGSGAPPPFPWPPPQAAHRGRFGVDFPRELLGRPDQTLGELHARLLQALQSIDERFEAGLFSAPGGFVLLTKLERTDREGRPLPGSRRWTEGKITPYSMSDLLARLFFERPGYFRELAFVVTDQTNFGYGDAPLPSVHDGGDLTDELAAQPLQGRQVYVLIYAFERKPGGESVPLQSLSALVHLHECGLSAALE